jgi:putative peptidoglycan lipid II flippase
VAIEQGAGGGREQGAGSREQGAGSREQGAGSREQGAGSREQQENMGMSFKNLTFLIHSETKNYKKQT